MSHDPPALDQPEDTGPPDPVPGEILGSWRLLRILGEGGMSSVWLAERASGSPGNPVALKLPRPGPHAAALSERIAREREILAALNHPHIAPLLDAGILTTGQPYLVLQYVKGRHIDDYCRECALSIDKRLELFLQIAHAIAYAHSLLIVHRDLKPSNILVTDDGQARVLDFGIAKLLQNGEAIETRLTRLSGRALTLDYASPEQLAGRPVTVASDIYSLGVVLYELLSGVRPYKLRRDSQAALEEAILEVEPRPPSQLAVHRSLARTLRGDLDTIVLKALKKDPAARYSSMDAFADDVRRYTSNLPVTAQPDRLWYRLSKFFRRHWLAASVSAAMIALVLAGTALVAWQARVALAERRRAEEIKSFLVSSLLDSHSYWSGRPLTALELLHRVQSRLDGLKGADTNTRVQLLNIIAASMLSLQDTAGAESATVAAVREAVALRDNKHPQALRARLLRNWVRLFRGQFAGVRDEINDLLSAMHGSPEVLPEDLAGALRIRSNLALEENDSALAEASALEALHVAEARLGPHHNQSVLALVDLSLAYQAGGKRDLSIETCERARGRALEAYGGQWNHPNTLKARVACSQVFAAAGQHARALDEAERALRDSAELFGPSSRIVGINLLNLARLQLDAGYLAPAWRNADRAISVLREHFDRQSPGYGALVQFRGLVLLAQRKYGAALRDLTLSERLAVDSLGSSHPSALAARAHRAVALARAGHLIEAREAFESISQAGSRVALSSGLLEHYLGVVQRLADRPTQALELQLQALRAMPPAPAAETLRMQAALEIGLNHLALARLSNGVAALSPVVAWCRQTGRATPYCVEASAALHRSGHGSAAFE